MTLPMMPTPTYELTIPSTKQKVKFRPFLVKEEKALMIAQQSEDEVTMLDTLKSVISACTFNKVDLEKLGMFDIEYMFIQLRAKSVGEISELLFNCLECNDPKAKMQVNVDLTKLNVTFNEEHNKNIELFGNVGVTMKYPTIDIMKKLSNIENADVDTVFDIVISCIDAIYTDDEIFSAKEQERSELEEFVNNLTQEQFNKIKKFFQTMPRLEHKIEFKCPVCGFEHKQTLQGLESFF